MGEMWMYVDATSGSEKGPLTEEIMKRLIRKGIIQPNQYVWNKTLKEWTPLMNVEPFKTYHETWSAFWYFMVEKQQKGPIVTKDLVSLFIDGEIDGLTIVWTKSMSEWKAIGEVQVLKEFLQEANADYERETEVLKKEAQVSAQDQVYEESTSDVFVADDGKQYLFDSETRKWVTPEEKIEDDLNALREEAAVVMHPNESKVNNTNNEDKEFNTRMPLSPTKSTLNVEQSSTNYSEATDEKPKKRKKKKKKSDKWKVSKKKTWVYVNGLPLDITEQEIHDHFSKCGLIQQDIMTNKPRIKLYENKDLGGLNGDASICYMKEASVELAVQLLDKSQIRPDWTIDVQPAVFSKKDDENFKRKRVKIDARAKVKMIEQQNALSWNEGENDQRDGLRIVVIKNMFRPEEIVDEKYEKELQEDIEFECAKLGTVNKITLFTKHPEGVVIIKFASSGSAATCIDVMNGRFFAGRKLTCNYWDGTNYTYRESKEEEQKRAEEFNQWLEGFSSSSDEESEEEEEKDDENIPSAEEVHTGRVMPALED